MNPTTELFREFGLSVSLVIIGSYFLMRRLWPWMTKQVEVAQQQTRDAQMHTERAYEAIAGLKEIIIRGGEQQSYIIDILKDIKGEVNARNKHT